MDTTIDTATTSRKHQYGQVVTIPGFCMDVISNAQFLDVINKYISLEAYPDVYHIHHKDGGHAVSLNIRGNAVNESLNKTEPSDVLFYCQDVPEIGYRTIFYWTKLVDGWICSSIRSRGNQLVSSDSALRIHPS